MAVKLKEQTTSSKARKSTNSEFLFFIALNLLVIPFSAYQTFIGYRNDVVVNEFAAITVAGISGVLFAAMNFGIRERRLKGQAHYLQTIMYIVPLSLSFFGNFNAFYSTQMRGELYTKDIERLGTQLAKTHSDATAALIASTHLNVLEEQMNAQLDQIEIQYRGAGGTKGWGPECQRNWQHLRALLEDANPNGARLTSFNPGISDEKKYMASKSIAKQYFGSIMRSKSSEIQPHIAYIDQRKSEADSIVQHAEKSNTIKSQGNAILSSIVKNNNAIGANVQGYLNNFSFVQLDPSEETQLGTIKHSINSAFIQWESKSATLFSLFISLVIDLAALLYILFFVPFNKNIRGARIAPRSF